MNPFASFTTNDVPAAMVDEARDRFKRATEDFKRTNHLPCTDEHRCAVVREFVDAGAVATESRWSNAAPPAIATPPAIAITDDEKGHKDG